MRFFFFFVLIFSALQVRSQIIDNRLGNAFGEEMFFNQQFLWQNRVKSMTGVTSIKRTNRPIEKRPDVIVYRFNEVGLLSHLDKISSVMYFVDSLAIEYQRNETGDVEVRKESGSKGYFTTQFNYDKDGHLIRQDFGKAENISAEKTKLEPGRIISINSETFNWAESGTGVWTRSNFNNYGLHYSNLTITRNSMDYLVSEVEELIMSGRTTTRLYTYDDHGWVSRIETTDNLNSPTRTEQFSYDPLGNLVRVEIATAGKTVREIEVLYTETMLIEAFLDHDLQSHDITITKFSYEFYP